MAWWRFWERFFQNEKTLLHPHELLPGTRLNVDADVIRTRLQNLGWNVKELPIREKFAGGGAHKVIMWKLVAIKGDKSFEVAGKTLPEAMTNLGRSLGVVPQNAT